MLQSIEYSSLTLAPSSSAVASEDTIMWRDTSGANDPNSFFLMTFSTLAAIVGSIISTTSGPGLTYGTSVPLSSDGTQGDSYINRSTGILYERGASTWTQIGVLALSASNLEATFATPSAGYKAATLG